MGKQPMFMPTKINDITVYKTVVGINVKGLYMFLYSIQFRTRPL